MKRRQVIQSLIGLPAITVFPAAAQVAQTSPSVAPAEDEIPKLAMTAAEVGAEAVPGFFSERQRVTLRSLAGAIVPARDGKPGAQEAGVPEFLDFLISHSPEIQQKFYRNGLDLLDSAAQNRFLTDFAKLSADQASTLLNPLHEPWTFRGPEDPLAQFLVTAKEDILRATLNSREWAAVSGRRAYGIGTYWYPVE